MSEGYQKQGPGKPQGFPGLSSDPRKFSTGGRWALWNGRCETAGALCAPLRKDRRGPRRGGFQPPEKPSPHRGEGVTAYAVTDEGSFYPRPCPRGVLSCGAEPLSGILRMKTGGGKTRPYVKTRAARGKRRARFARPLVSHRTPLFCQGRRDTLVGYARQFNTPAAAAQTGGWVSSSTRAGYGRHAQGPASPVLGVRGKADCGTQAERMWSRGPAGSVTRRRFAAGGKVSRPAGRNPLEAETVGWKEDPSSVTAYAVTPSPLWGEGFMLARRIFCRVHHDEKIKS